MLFDSDTVSVLICETSPFSERSNVAFRVTFSFSGWYNIPLRAR